MRRSRLRWSRTSKHATRERDVPFMLWVKTQPCLLRGVAHAGPCAMFRRPGDDPAWISEADHAGDRFKHGDGYRAHDSTCIPLCTRHHRDREQRTGFFAPMTKAERRAWLDDAITMIRALWGATMQPSTRPT